jgi:hypothetical protein
MQLGKLDVSQAYQALSCKTADNSPQSDQRVRAEKQNFSHALHLHAAPALPDRRGAAMKHSIDGVGFKTAEKLVASEGHPQAQPNST